MKNLLVTLVMLISLSALSQTKNPFKIEHCIDKMTDKEYFFSQKKLICSNPEKTKGFILIPNFKSVNDTLTVNGISCENIFIGSCDEKDSLIFMFDDETKITLASWNAFNCEGNSYYDVNEEQFAQLSTKKIKSIRFSNGYTYDSLTYSLKPTEKNYFLRAYTDNEIVEVDCSK